ncbi:MAG: AmmeMemoRadiSam system protein B, partial [Anaerolineaceae bacterium]|nr:AmmeMemoRadiSam system protein B [Anaerolineaceae bacterium]
HMEGDRMNTLTDLRPSPIAGQWYSDDPHQLAAQVDRFLAQAQLPPLLGEVVAVIAPHAGHLYSGAVAGFAFKAIMSLPVDLVAVISPMHHPYPQPLLTSSHNGYVTPLGTVTIAKDSVAQLDQLLRNTLHFGLTPVSRDQEHSLEIELPFLQRALDEDFELLPVMVRDQDPETMRALGNALAETLKGRKALLVASSDLSHFYPARTAERLDAEILRQVEAFSPEGLYEADRSGKGYACGLGAIAAVLYAAHLLGGTTARVLQYATSGDVTRDYTSVVGYGAAVILKPA